MTREEELAILCRHPDYERLRLEFLLLATTLSRKAGDTLMALLVQNYCAVKHPEMTPLEVIAKYVGGVDTSDTVAIHNMAMIHIELSIAITERKKALEKAYGHGTPKV